MSRNLACALRFFWIAAFLQCNVSAFRYRRRGAASVIPPSFLQDQCNSLSSSVDDRGRLFVMRGGGWLGSIIPGSSKRQYRSLLEEQRDLLEQQLRQTQEELLQLRKQFQAIQQADRPGGSSRRARRMQDKRKVDLQVIRTLRQHIADMEQELIQLGVIKAKLEKMLKQEQLKAQLMQSQLDKLRKSSAEMKEQYQQDLAALKKEMEDQATKQLEELRKLMEQRIKEALEQAKRAAELERVEAVRSAELRVQQQADKRLADEKRKAEQAVECEKAKMRKLIKALAEREKKLLAQEKEISSGRKAAVVTSGRRSNKQAQTNPGTVRGPLK